MPSDSTTIFVCITSWFLEHLSLTLQENALGRDWFYPICMAPSAKKSPTQGQGSNCRSRKERIINENSHTAPLPLAASDQLPCRAVLWVSEPTSAVAGGSPGTGWSRLRPSLPLAHKTGSGGFPDSSQRFRAPWSPRAPLSHGHSEWCVRRAQNKGREEELSSQSLYSLNERKLQIFGEQKILEYLALLLSLTSSICHCRFCCQLCWPPLLGQLVGAMDTLLSPNQLSPWTTASVPPAAHLDWETANPRGLEGAPTGEVR